MDFILQILILKMEMKNSMIYKQYQVLVRETNEWKVVEPKNLKPGDTFRSLEVENLRNCYDCLESVCAETPEPYIDENGNTRYQIQIEPPKD